MFYPKSSFAKKIATLLLAIAISLFSNTLLAAGTPQYLGGYCFTVTSSQKTVNLKLGVTFMGDAYYLVQGSGVDSSNNTGYITGSAIASGSNIIVSASITGLVSGVLTANSFQMLLNSQLNGSYASVGAGYTATVTFNGGC